MKTIHRRKLRANFTTLPNELLRSKSLSFRARGLLAMMLSHSEEWRSTIKSLPQFSQSEGITAVRSAVHELEAAGYAVRKRLCAVDGKFQGYMWTWHDIPVSLDQRSKAVVRKSDDGLPDDGSSDDGKPHELRKTNLKKDYQKESKVLKRERTRGSSSTSEAELANAPDISWEADPF